MKKMKAFNRVPIISLFIFLPLTSFGQWSGTDPVWTNSAVAINNYYQKRIYLTRPGENAGNGKWFIRLHPSTMSNVASVRITVHGSWSWADIFGWLTGEYAWYCPGDNSILNTDFRITSTTGSAYANLRLGPAVVENGYVSIPVWCTNTNNVAVLVEWYDSADIISSNLTSTSWMPEPLPQLNYQSVKSNLIVDGSVGIGNNNPGSYKLNVSGKIRADEIVVNTSGADFVFDPDYNLPDLAEVERYIEENKHLPDVAPASEMQADGMNVSEMQTKMLQKIEELTLYVIELKKEIETLKSK
ncbi:MAG TPA: hypothetical protein VHO50_12010 [Bacteroidales bacterium]|nr:hypothetical protein [Bacteroidales bacterium]